MENWKLVGQDLTHVPTVWSTLGQDILEAARNGLEIQTHTILWQQQHSLITFKPHKRKTLIISTAHYQAPVPNCKINKLLLYVHCIWKYVGSENKLSQNHSKNRKIPGHPYIRTVLDTYHCPSYPVSCTVQYNEPLTQKIKFTFPHISLPGCTKREN